MGVPRICDDGHSSKGSWRGVAPPEERDFSENCPADSRPGPLTLLGKPIEQVPGSYSRAAGERPMLAQLVAVAGYFAVGQDLAEGLRALRGHLRLVDVKPLELLQYCQVCQAGIADLRFAQM